MSAPQDAAAFDRFLQDFLKEEAKLGVVHRSDGSFVKNLASLRWSLASESTKERYRKLAFEQPMPQGESGDPLMDLPLVVMKPKIDVKKTVPTPESIEAFNTEYGILLSRVGTSFKDFPFVIASSNVFIRKTTNAMPAEMGFVKYSFQTGIIGSFHSFFPPDPISSDDYYDVIQFSRDYHKIPLEHFDFPDLHLTLCNVHKFIHATKDGQSKHAYIFAESEEFNQVCQILEVFEEKSKKLNLKLVWNVTCIRLNTLFVYLKEVSHSKGTKWIQEDEDYVFKTRKFDCIDMCYFHERNNCRHCAISKAYIHCYIMSEYFCTAFGIPMKASFHAPLKGHKSHNSN